MYRLSLVGSVTATAQDNVNLLPCLDPLLMGNVTVTLEQAASHVDARFHIDDSCKMPALDRDVEASLGLFRVNSRFSFRPTVFLVRSAFRNYQSVDAAFRSRPVALAAGRELRIRLASIGSAMPNPSIPTEVSHELRDGTCGDAVKLEGPVDALVVAVRSDAPIANCSVVVAGVDAVTGEVLPLGRLEVSVRDCFESCNSGRCKEDADPFDGAHPGCVCEPEWTGALCNIPLLRVSWRLPQGLPSAVLGRTLDIGEPLEATVVVGDQNLTGVAQVDYLLSGLPFGTAFNASRNQIAGTPRESGVFNVTVVATVNYNGNDLTSIVNEEPFSLTVVDCDPAFNCNGGDCVDTLPFDGRFACNCSQLGKAGAYCEFDPFSVTWNTGLAGQVLAAGAVGVAYTAQPPSNVTVVGEDEGSLRYVAAGLPCGMAMDPASGGITGATTASGEHEVVVVALSLEGLTAQVNGGPFTLPVNDCDDQTSCNGGRCVDAVPYDGKFACNCAGIRGTGPTCDLVRASVSWAGVPQQLPGAVFGERYDMDKPTASLLGAAAVIKYQALDLPCGMSIDIRTGQLQGRPAVAGSFSVTVQAQVMPDFRIVEVTQSPFALTVRDCDPVVSCHGGFCEDSTPFDGLFACDCTGTGRVGKTCEVDASLVAGAVPFSVSWPNASQALPAAVLGHGLRLQPNAGASAIVVSDGHSVASFLASGLPCGARLDPVTGAITGFAREQGRFNVSLLAQSNSSQTALVNDKAFVMTVNDCSDELSCNGGRCVDKIPFDGQFECDCEAIGRVGTTCDAIPVTLPSASTGAAGISGAQWAGVAIGILVALLLALYAGLALQRRRTPKQQPFDFEEMLQRMRDEGSLPAAQLSDKPREVSRRCVTLLEELGSGQFGEVCKASVDEVATTGVPAYLAAAKTLKAGASTADKNELMEEAAIMAGLRHPNLVGLVGVCTTDFPILMVIEYCEHGSLLSFLRKRQGFDALCITSKRHCVKQCAMGMEHLASLGMVHRDLAARNVLVDSTYRCKIVSTKGRPGPPRLGEGITCLQLLTAGPLHRSVPPLSAG